MIPVIHCDSGGAATTGCVELPRNVATVAASLGNIENAAGEAIALKTAPAASITTMTATARAATRPLAATSLAAATPVTSSETTSGTTVMRIALSHSSPTGSIHATTAATIVFGAAARSASPAPTPAA